MNRTEQSTWDSESRRSPYSTVSDPEEECCDGTGCEDCQEEPVCGHTITANGFLFVCDLRPDHKTLHTSHVSLRDSVSVTHWGDDGLARWATKDPRAAAH